MNFKKQSIDFFVLPNIKANFKKKNFLRNIVKKENM